tara:strand:+ start:328 stop:471 length:144 start_codon:yes stop_codon:yes gene_type:complete
MTKPIDDQDFLVLLRASGLLQRVEELERKVEHLHHALQHQIKKGRMG